MARRLPESDYLEENARPASGPVPLPLFIGSGPTGRTRQSGARVWRPLQLSDIADDPQEEQHAGTTDDFSPAPFGSMTTGPGNDRSFLGSSPSSGRAVPSDLPRLQTDFTRSSPFGQNAPRPQAEEINPPNTGDSIMDEIVHLFGRRLPDPIALNAVQGQCNGEVMFIAHPNRDVFAHQWFDSLFQWVYIGHYSSTHQKIEGPLASEKLKGQTVAKRITPDTLAYFREVAHQWQQEVQAGKKATPSGSLPTVDRQRLAFTHVADDSIDSTGLSVAGNTQPRPPLHAFGSLDQGSSNQGFQIQSAQASVFAQQSATRASLEDPFYSPPRHTQQRAQLLSPPDIRERPARDGAEGFSLMRRPSAGTGNGTDGLSRQMTVSLGHEQHTYRPLGQELAGTVYDSRNTRPDGFPQFIQTNLRQPSQPVPSAHEITSRRVKEMLLERTANESVMVPRYQPPEPPTLSAMPHQRGGSNVRSTHALHQEPGFNPLLAQWGSEASGLGLHESEQQNMGAKDDFLGRDDTPGNLGFNTLPDRTPVGRAPTIASSGPGLRPTLQNFRGPFFADAMPTYWNPTIALRYHEDDETKLRKWFKDGARPKQQEDYFAYSMKLEKSRADDQTRRRPSKFGIIGEASPPPANPKSAENSQAFFSAYTNLKDYEQESLTGKRHYFTRGWTKPAPHLIDSGPNGNYSFFGERLPPQAPSAGTLTSMTSSRSIPLHPGVAWSLSPGPPGDIAAGPSYTNPSPWNP